SYFVWLFGKPPDVVGEIVSDRRGDEDSLKVRQYARLGIRHYFIYDPKDLLGGGKLRTYGLYPKGYELIENHWLDGVGLGLTLWQGMCSGIETEWLRWCDQDGHLIPTSDGRAEQEKRRAEQEKRRADEQAERIQRLEAQ